MNSTTIPSGKGESTSNAGGASAVGGEATDEKCSEKFASVHGTISSIIPTVGVVEWSWTGEPPSTAKIVYHLKDASVDLLNLGGEAPVRLERENLRTLLLGLKQSSSYQFHIEVVASGKSCVSREYELPQTGNLPGLRSVAVEVLQAGKREPGFIVTSSGTSLPSYAYILDADGEVVWSAPALANTSRALLDYEGDNLWMVSLNMINTGGGMRSVSMDGERTIESVSGLENAHHDFTVLPGGRIAALVWSNGAIDPESVLVVRSPDGTLKETFRVGSNLYVSDAFHANAIHYLPFDDTFTIADRNPNVIVNVAANGAVNWQVGGSCEGAPAGERCHPMDWLVVHGHHLLEDGTLLVFNNGYSGMSHSFEFSIDANRTSFGVNLERDYPGTAESFNLGDVQRLPGGNTLITYATDERIVEVDADWNEVQTFSTRVGYASFRPTLYGPPIRP